MEQILKIVKQLTGQVGLLADIPKPVRMAIMYFSVFVAVVVIFKYAKIGEGEKIFLIVLIVLLALIATGYYLWKKSAQKKESEGFREGMSQHSAATPRGLSDPGQRARLDDLRKKFQSGVDAFKSRGKDIYKLPWYVMVGEPGSGKTEAIRHSNVGFPPGMQDEFQGVGGTVNMNWWFTNHAVLLDTAGRLMFEEVKPGETNEWKEFLNLLKKNRPSCPINGLFLVIPADSLIKDTGEAIQKKAGRIAMQLDVIQRTLDVRFPVFVVISKCDKMNGFREFFDGLTDPQLQHQMMGWSNPDPLDQPFKPELVDKHLEQVASRLRRRRLGMLRDPVPENPEARRTDEVDTLYALPHSLEMLGSRLRRYLETIFTAGEWSAKPLFLRGIYFSSSMREGAALDAELAAAIGVGIEELPEGKVWERERAYFLRDLFLEKVFREKGLVTRANNTKQMLRSQKIALYSFGAGALLVFLIVAWFAMGSLKSGIKDQGDYWKVVSSAGFEDDKLWKESIVQKKPNGAVGLSTNLFVVDNNSVNLGQFLVKIRELSDRPLKKSLLMSIMFPTLASSYGTKSHRAEKILFESAVVRPLIEASREKMKRGDDDEGSLKHEPDALVELVRLEADILNRGIGTNTGTVSPEFAARFLGALESYVAGEDVVPDSNIVSVMAWTYSTNETGKGYWPSRALGGGRGGNSLTVNSGISAGLELFARGASNSVQSYIAAWEQVTALRSAVLDFQDHEKELYTAAADGKETSFLEAQKALEAARKRIDEGLNNAAKQHLLSGPGSLGGVQQNFKKAVTDSGAGALSRLRAVNDAGLASNKDHPLFKEVKERLNSLELSLSRQVNKLLDSGDATEFQLLDEKYLNGSAYSKRADMYAKASKAARESLFADGNLFGLKADPLEKVINDTLAAARSDAETYSPRITNQFMQIVSFELKLEGDSFFSQYMANAKKQMGRTVGFPLVLETNRMATVDDFKSAGKQLKFIADDFASPVFQKYSTHERTKEWRDFAVNLEGEQAVAKALLTEEGGPSSCTISLAGMSDATHSKDEWRLNWRDIILATDGLAGNGVRTGSGDDQSFGDVSVQQKLEFKVFKNGRDPDPHSPRFSIATTEWGPVALLHSYKSEKLDAKTWLVEIPYKEKGQDIYLRLKLKFEHPLPALDEWPVL